MATAAEPCCPDLAADAVSPVIEQPVPVNAASDPAEIAGIWEWMRTGFAMPVADLDRVRPYIDEYVKHPFLLEQLLQRGEPYLFHILKRLEWHDMPAELALLPVIESAFDPFATSPAGAVGIWQFMPATASDAGLDLDWWYDGRRDIVASTDAAIEYLKQLNQAFDGDWFMTLAAYNAGSARVRRAIRQNREAGKPVDFWHLTLPPETRAYIPKLIALRTIIDNPGRFDIALPDLPARRYFATVEIEKQIELAVAAQLAGVSLAELQRLNPGYDRSITPPDRVSTLLLPKHVGYGIGERIAQLPREQRIRSIRHHIRSGDNLSTIAQQYGTTVSALRKVNRLNGSKIITGEILMVPVGRHDETVADAGYATVM